VSRPTGWRMRAGLEFTWQGSTSSEG
jgi:hypothetical protein